VVDPKDRHNRYKDISESNDERVVGIGIMSDTGTSYESRDSGT